MVAMTPRNNFDSFSLMVSKRRQIRSEMFSIMSSLDERWLRAASGELCRHLSGLIEESFASRISVILAWTSFFKGEPDLSSFISEQLEKRVVYLPRSLPDLSMSFISVGRNWGETIEAGPYGILEPGAASGEAYTPDLAKRSAVIVPGVAFDRQGNRLGRGKGYYDRFLGMPEMESAVKIGVSWTLQITEEIPVHSHDVRMDWVCTEDGFFKV